MSRPSEWQKKLRHVEELWRLGGPFKGEMDFEFVNAISLEAALSFAAQVRAIVGDGVRILVRGPDRKLLVRQWGQRIDATP